MMTKREYADSLPRTLQRPKEAEAYLNASLEKNDPALFLLALRNVAEAQDGMTEFAKKAKLNRENLCRILSRKGNPEPTSLTQILVALGFHFSVGLKSRAS